MNVLLCLCDCTGASRTAQLESVEDEGHECCQVDFLNDVAAVMPSAWCRFGLCIGIDYGKLEAVGMKNHGDQLLCFAEVYSIWRKEQFKLVTWETVVEVLQKNMIKNMSLSYQLRRKYCDT